MSDVKVVLVLCKGCGRSFHGPPQKTLKKWFEHGLKCELFQLEHKWFEIRQMILERDSFQCIECGSKKNRISALSCCFACYETLRKRFFGSAINKLLASMSFTLGDRCQF